MDGIPVSRLASTIGLSVDQLVQYLNEIGIQIESEKELVTGMQQLRLLQHLPTLEKESSSNRKFEISHVQNATDLRNLNQLLTDAMTARKIQALIRDNNLSLVADAVLALVAGRQQQLLAAAVLGRLAAVARGRESEVLSRADSLLTTEPHSIEALDDADEKTYAATLLAHSTQPWVLNYSYREAVRIDTADTARRELLSATLSREESISGWVTGITRHADVLRDVKNEERRIRRVRRISLAMRDVASRWRGDVGAQVGNSLANCMHKFLSTAPPDVDPELLHESMDNFLSVLCRVIEIRFSSALYSSTYSMIYHGKKIFGPGRWGRFIDSSAVIPNLRNLLLESALVLARQNRSDQHIMDVMLASYTSRPQVAAAIKRHFADVHDLDPDTAEWWCNAGRGTAKQRTVEHRIGNNEDAQIGALLIEVDSYREAMEKVARAIVPFLDVSDPVSASTARKAVEGFRNIEQTTRRLCRMRKLTKTELAGERLEYNPLEHELLGGHKPGVRRVRIVRDGIQKEFSGRIKTLVKPWVEAE